MQAAEPRGSGEPRETRYPLRSDAEMRQIAEDVLAHARKLGATDCAVDVDEGNGLTVNVRRGRIETIEQNHDKGVGVTVYLGGVRDVRRGNASTSDLTPAALRDAVEAAYHIARFTAVDEAAALPDDDWYAREPLELDLDHPWNLDAAGATEIARRAEAAALETSPMIRNSEGGNVSLQHGRFVSANSRGFVGGHAHSYHSIAVAPIASRPRDGMQRDEWYASRRDPRDLPSPESVGRYAAERALARLGARKIDTCTVPVLFEAPIAGGLVGSYIGAASGRALYRSSSFLVGKLGQRVFADHIDIVDDPFVPKGMASGWFDDDGVATQKRTVVDGGVLTGWFLEHVLGAQARSRADRQRRRRAQRPADEPPHEARRRLRRDAEEARHRPARHRADGPGRQHDHRRLLARRIGLLGRARRHRISGRGGHDRRQPRRDVRPDRRGRQRRLGPAPARRPARS